MEKVEILRRNSPTVLPLVSDRKLVYRWFLIENWVILAKYSTSFFFY